MLLKAPLLGIGHVSDGTHALDVAAWMLNRVDRSAGDSVTHLKLQKLVYYSQAWALALLDRPIFEEDFQAWAHGPVAPSVYRAFQAHGWSALDALDRETDFDPEIVTLLDDVYGVYGGMTAKQLENITHAENPWKDARGQLAPEARSTSAISKQAMKAYYLALFEKSNGEQAQ